MGYMFSTADVAFQFSIMLCLKHRYVWHREMLPQTLRFAVLLNERGAYQNMDIHTYSYVE